MKKKNIINKTFKFVSRIKNPVVGGKSMRKTLRIVYD